MNCPSCHRENSSSNAYCGACGVALARVCANCDRENAPGDSFCGGCGQKLEKHVAARAQGTAVREPQSYTPKHLAEKILTSRSALEGERKQVTVLFADLKGSMELSAGMIRKNGTECSTGSSGSLPTVFTVSREQLTSTPAMVSWRCSARRSHMRITRSAPAMPRCIFATTYGATLMNSAFGVGSISRPASVSTPAK